MINQSYKAFLHRILMSSSGMLGTALLITDSIMLSLLCSSVIDQGVVVCYEEGF